MTRRSLHIALNHVDKDHYDGWDGALSGCINDANAMVAIAESRGYTTRKMLIDADATIENVHAELKDAADSLMDGDYFFLTYSGHGGQVPDIPNPNDPEADGFDETWCLYNGQLVDDSLYGGLCAFAEGVRIVMVSDSCHSETANRDRPINERDEIRKEIAEAKGYKPRQAPKDVTVKEFKENPEAYAEQVAWWTGGTTPDDAKAKVVLMSGCKDKQVSMDGKNNGAFTEAFLKVWHDGDYKGNYSEIVDEVQNTIDTAQTPSLFAYGEGVGKLLREQVLIAEDANAGAVTATL